MVVTFNAISLMGLIITGAILPVEPLTALFVGVPSGFVFGLTYREGCPFSAEFWREGA